MSDNDGRDDGSQHFIPLPPESRFDGWKRVASFHTHAIMSHPVCWGFLGLSGAAIFTIFALVDGEMIVVVATIGFICACIGWIASPTLSSLAKGACIAMTFTAFAVEGVAVYWHSHPDAWTAKKTQTPAAVESKLLIQCIGGSPPSVVPASGGYDVIPLISNNFRRPGPLASSHLFSFSSPGTPWKPAGDSVLFAYRCEVVNYESIALFRVQVGLRFEFRKAIPQAPTGSTGGPLILGGVFTYSIPRVDPGPNNPYVFYIWNMADNEFANVWLPSEATATRLGDDKSMRIKLIATGRDDIWMGPALRPKPVSGTLFRRGLQKRPDSGSTARPTINIGSGNKQSGSHNAQDIQVQSH